MRYFLEFKKIGDIKYTSHLDMQRLFKRTFKRAGIPIEYSQGYNPHPKMGFAQPLSLGYTATNEYLEFNTETPINLDIAKRELVDALPEGIVITRVEPLDIEAKSLASDVESAVYSVYLPIPYRFRHEEIEEMVESYLAQDVIMAKKREKKTKKIVDKDIKSQIRAIQVKSSHDNEVFKLTEKSHFDSEGSKRTFSEDDGYIVLEMELDSGSKSNLSPEQVISSFTEFTKLYLPREEIEVNRDKIIFETTKLD